MPWSKPNFEEITLCMEVTAYVNTDDEVRISEESRTQPESTAAGADQPQAASA